MKPSITTFTITQSTYYWKAVANLYRFIPYLCSAPLLVRTLFYPWKRVTRQKEIPGFSIEEFLTRTSYNTISSVIGTILRINVLVLCLSALLLLIALSLPVFFVFLVLVVLVGYPTLLLSPTEEERRGRLRDEFLKLRVLKPEHRAAGEAWFARWWGARAKYTDWSGLEQLFAVPPIGRNWHMGFSVTIDRYSTELTRPNPHAPHLVGRQKEIDQIEQILVKSSESNVVIVGKEGVGKHTIVEELAKRIYEGKTVGPLAYKRVLALSTETVLSATIDQNGKREILRGILDEAARAGNIILVIDSFDRYVAEGQGRIDLSDVIAPYAKGSQVQLVGITTPVLYQAYLFPNGTVSRLFQKVDVYEISKQEATVILMDATGAFEERFGVLIPYDTLHAAVEKSENYITHIPFPEKAIELLDEACAFVSRRQRKGAGSHVTPAVIDAVLTQKTHIPTILTSHTIDKLNTLEHALSSRIIDQNDAIKKVASAVARAFLVFGKRKKPLATLLFLGPTGVGKTQTAKELAAFFFESELYLYRFDMASYQTKEDIRALIGSADAHTTGLLTRTIREHPYGILLLDELEKADKNLLNIFLPILDEGYFTDGTGETVSCKNLIIIATSNAGSDLLYQKMKKGSQLPGTQAMMDYLIEENIFEPEFLNRFDEIILYEPLSEASFVRIARAMLTSIADAIKKQHGIKIAVSDATLNTLIKSGYDQTFGARNIERLLKTHVEDVVARRLFAKEIKEGEAITL